MGEYKTLGAREGEEESEKRERGREDGIKTFIRSGAEKSACISCVSTGCNS